MAGHDENGLPARVERTRAFLSRSGVWFRLGRNSAATSCRDAAARRVRLGTTGIPLYDELKSLCVVLYRGEERMYALLHCRASARIDLEAAARVLGATRPLARLASEELSERFGGTSYGTVNPFAEGDHFVQVFDSCVLDRLTPPHTMMTNAGDLTWSIEFEPKAAIDSLRAVTEVHVADVVAGGAERVRLPSIGILTGNGPESGQVLWQRINEAVHEVATADGRLVGDLVYPRVLVHSEPEMGLSMELVERDAQVWHVVSEGVDRLCDAGADLIAIACNTTQYYADRIRERCEPREVEFVSMAEVAIEYIRSAGLRDLTVIGIPVVAELGEHSAYRPLRDLGVHPVHERARPHLHDLGYQVKRLSLGEKDSRALNTLRHVLQVGVETENVLIALTEISVLLQRFPRFAEHLAGRRLIDPLKLYADNLARRYVEALPPTTVEDDSWSDGSEVVEAPHSE